MAPSGANAKLERRFLGNSGLEVSRLCLGTMTFGASERPGNCAEAAAHELLDRYAELGGNFVDTADVYQSGESESIVGSWLARRRNRDDVVLATKFFFPVGDSSSRGASRRHMVEALERSLRRLGVACVDVYQQHCWDAATPVEETLRTADDLIRCGKIRYFGVSNFAGWQLQKAVDRSQLPIVALQQQYSLLCRQPEWEQLPVCTNEQVSLLAWGPLKGGLLAGKFSRDARPSSDTRIGWSSARGAGDQSHPTIDSFGDAEWRVVDAVRSVAERRGRSCSQVAIGWLLARPTVASVIVGAKNLRQLEDNLASVQLSAEDADELTAASDIAEPYPYEMLRRHNVNFGRMRRPFAC